MHAITHLQHFVTTYVQKLFKGKNATSLLYTPAAFGGVETDARNTQAY